MKKLHLTTCLLAYALAFDGGVTAGWKKDADGHLELKDGNPIFVNAAGQEQVHGADTITRLNGEARVNRERAEKAEGLLKPFEGLDPVAAKDAMEKISKIDQKKLVDAGQIDTVRAEISKQFQDKLDAESTRNNSLQDKLNNMEISNVFSSSELLRDGLAVPRDLIEASLRSNFKVGADGKIEVYGRDGNRLYSKDRVSEYATPEEGMRILIEQRADKDTILKADVGNGSGNKGNGGNSGKGSIIKRAEWNAMSGNKQAELGAQMAKGEITIVD